MESNPTGSETALAGWIWRFTDTLNAARGEHTATLLTNGTVLVAGGDGITHSSVGPIASAELYDPASGLWIVTGPLKTARHRHTATLLQNGVVLVAGGIPRKFTVLASAELYDPASGTWTPTGRLHTARRDHTATLLQNGMVLVAGGTETPPALGSEAVTVSATAELYDPASGRWTATGSLSTERTSHTARCCQTEWFLSWH